MDIRSSFTLPVVAAMAMFPATSAQADEMSGRLGTLPHGAYVCSLPGDAAGPAWVELPGNSFSIENASVYRTADGSGTYLLAGKRVRFTRGPMKGMKFERNGNASLRRIDENGAPGRMRCVRSGASR